MEEKYLCSHCGAELTQEEMTEFEGNIYCADCLNDLTTVCDCCGDRIHRDEAEGDSETTLCHHCYDYNYRSVFLSSAPSFALRYAGAISNTVLQPL